MQSVEGYKAIRLIYWLNLVYVLVSYLHAAIIGEYNGDFLGTSVSLQPTSLALVMLACMLPYWGLWRLYKFYKKREAPKKVYIELGIVKFFVFGLLVSHIVVTAIFGVGKALAPVYEAPALIKLFIQIILRFDSNIWASFLIFLLPKKSYRAIIITLLLITILGILKAFMSFIYTFIIILIIKYYSDIRFFVKRYIHVVILAAIVFPSFVEYVYNQRDILRGVGQGDVKYQTDTLIAGKLIGRLSSFSNTAILVDEAPLYFIISQQFDSFFFPKRMLAVIDGANFGKDKSPEQLLKEDTPEGVSFMLGTTGILIFSLYNSIFSFFISLSSIVLVCILVFELSRRFNFSMNIEFAFICLLGSIVSGVSIEYFLNLLVIFIIFVTLLLFRTFKLFIKNL